MDRRLTCRISLGVALLGLLFTLPPAAALATVERSGPAPELRGGLRVTPPEGGAAVEMPLTDLAVRAEVSGSLATVEVEQTYANPFEDRVEAVYVFPLPEDAAVIDMVMLIGDRRIRSDLQEREEARRTYEAARDRGQTTALLEQERSNVFTQSVANIQPGHPIRVLITYVEQLPFSDGQYHFAFPMVVGPRFVPGAPEAHTGSGVLDDTAEVPDASRITPPVLPSGVEAPYEVDLQLRLDAGLPIRELVSSSHELDLTWIADGRVEVALAAHERQPDRDVVIDYALTEDAPAVGLLTHVDERGGFFSLQIEPPSDLAGSDVRPKELVFVIDMSGSMYGHPLDTSKAAMRHALSHLNPDDTFQVIRFSDEASPLAPRPLANTPANVEAALAYVESLEGMGGTNMQGGIRAALEPAADPERVRIVLFLTDGYIGNESAVLSLVTELLGESRLFSLGVGSSVNRFLLDKLAEVGRGTVHYVNVSEDTGQVVGDFYERIRHPVLTDVRIDWGGLDVSEVAPEPLPDVFAAAPLLVTGRYGRPGSGTVTISGQQGRRPVSFELDVTLSDRPTENRAIPYIWARREVDRIESRSHWDGGEEARVAVLPLALEFGLLTRYTSFVAVEDRVAVDPDLPLNTVAVAVALPEGLSDERIGMQVSPQYVQPGDPELTVQAPADALGVTAYFPFELTQSLDYDPERHLWTSRFVVPRDFEEGEHSILVAVERGDGRVHYTAVPLFVDSTAPVIEARLTNEGPVRTGDVVTFEVRLLVPTWETCAVAEAEDVCADVLPEAMKLIRLYLPDGRLVRMLPSEDEDGLWVFHYRVRPELGAGRFEVTVEAVDVAENVTMTSLVLEVAEAVARAER